MAIKTGKPSTTKPKRLSKGMRKHVRRMKQEARNTTAVTVSKKIPQKIIQPGE
jgi:hypothetical protein